MTDDRRVGDQRREQETADRALRELFAGRPCPDLPPFFASRCAARAELQPSARPLGARERLVMRTYWALAAVVSGVVLGPNRLAGSDVAGRRGRRPAVDRRPHSCPFSSSRVARRPVRADAAGDPQSPAAAHPDSRKRSTG